MTFFKWIHNFDIGVLKKGICLAEKSPVSEFHFEQSCW